MWITQWHWTKSIKMMGASDWHQSVPLANATVQRAPNICLRVFLSAQPGKSWLCCLNKEAIYETTTDILLIFKQYSVKCSRKLCTSWTRLQIHQGLKLVPKSFASLLLPPWYGPTSCRQGGVMTISRRPGTLAHFALWHGHSVGIKTYAHRPHTICMQLV